MRGDGGGEGTGEDNTPPSGKNEDVLACDDKIF